MFVDKWVLGYGFWIIERRKYRRVLKKFYKGFSLKLILDKVSSLIINQKCVEIFRDRIFRNFNMLIFYYSMCIVMKGEFIYIRILFYFMFSNFIILNFIL